jgi:hypothetical protein
MQHKHWLDTFLIFMSFYFKLQFQLFRRLLLRQAISPRLVILVFLLGFVPFSNYLFAEVGAAKHLYTILPVTFLFRLSASGRNNFIKSVYSANQYHAIRLAENSLVCLPFLGYLLYQGFFLEAGALLLAALLLSLFRFNAMSSFVVPTPFYKYPFEFLVGFRKVFLLLPIAYALAVIGYFAKNNNLGIAAMLFVFALCISFYNAPEKSIFVWIYKASPKQFINQKISIGLKYSSFLTLPILLFLCVVSPENADVYLLFQLGGYAFLIAVIIAKYASFPEQISMPHGIVIAVCLAMPPLILLVIPFLFNKAVLNLKSILND